MAITAQILTFPVRREHSARKELKNSERSGIRTRQTCGFFVPGYLAGRATDTTPACRKEVRRLRSVLNLPASLAGTRKNVSAGANNLTQETSMSAAQKSAVPSLADVQNKLQHVDALSQEGFRRITAIASVSRLALQADPDRAVSEVLICLGHIEGLACEYENSINAEAEEVGCNYKAPL